MESIRQWLEEHMLCERGVVPGPELDKRIGALRHMFTNWRNMNVTQFQEAMTVAHFTNYFGDALSRFFYGDYAYKTGDWPNYTFPDTAPDFRDVDRYRMTEPEGLVRRGELKDHAETDIAESAIHYGVEEYSRSFSVSWRTIMNDDLGKIQETPARMGRSAGRWLDAWVSALYDNATTQAALVALGAVYAGTGRLTHQNLAIALNAMMQRPDARGNPMQISRVHLVIPPILRIQADVILRSTLASGGAFAMQNDANVLPGYLAGYWVDPYITTTALSVPWYLVADPSEVPAITVQRLAGWTGPIVFQKSANIALITGTAPAPFLMGSFEHGDIVYAVEDVVGAWDNATWVGVTDFRGIYYSSGTTP